MIITKEAGRKKNKKNNRKNKKSQSMSLPFTLIFSVILIAVVLFVGFYVINMFLDRTKQAEFNLLATEIQEKISTMRFSGASEANQDVEFKCPDDADLNYICFVDFSTSKEGVHKDKYAELKNFAEDANFFYYPLMVAEKYHSSSEWTIKCGDSDCVKVPDNANPFCVEIINDKVKFKLVKESGQPYIFVKP